VQIINENQTESGAISIPAGKQLTLSAVGLSGSDTVVVEIVTLSKAPEFQNNPCCDLVKANIQVLSSVPLRCGDGNAVVMTAEYPWVVIDAPQNVPLRARVVAEPDATVQVDMHITEGDGCMSCTCRCFDSEWTPTGAERCVGNRVHVLEKSNCGTERWTDSRDVVWTPTGSTRCENNLVENQEVNDCGVSRWTPTATGCGFCPSLRISCDGQAGYGFHEMDPKDPAATVEMAPCADDTSVDSIWIYPTAGKGHTVKVMDCDGTLIGYAVNTSDCAADCGCPQTKFEVINHFNPSTNVTLPAPKLVALSVNGTGAITATNSDGSIVTGQIPTC